MIAFVIIPYSTSRSPHYIPSPFPASVRPSGASPPIVGLILGLFRPLSQQLSWQSGRGENYIGTKPNGRSWTVLFREVSLFASFCAED